LSGNPIATTAGLATLRALGDEVYATVDRRAAELSKAVSDALGAAGVQHQVQSAGSLFSVFFTDTDVIDFAGAQRQEAYRYRAFFHAMLASGVYLPPSAFEAWFLSGAHDDEAMGQVVSALPGAAQAAAAAKADPS
jgi:glutamate-1-semialdehyde 2,1-aminomutase